jgi:hypothetical protein
MRAIYCPTCSAGFNIHPDDITEGWKLRRIAIKVHRPEQGHEIIIKSGDETSVIDVPIVVCDSCNCELPEGTDAFAVTMYKGQEPPAWEEAYQCRNAT